jgi:hypothetical protein
MDLIYNVQDIGENKLLTGYDIPISDPYILAIIQHGNCVTDKAAIIQPEGCNEEWVLNFEGVANVYEDLLSGLIYYNFNGTWNAELYYQASDSNTDPDNAIFIDSINLQVS